LIINILSCRCLLSPQDTSSKKIIAQHLKKHLANKFARRFISSLLLYSLANSKHQNTVKRRAFSTTANDTLFYQEGIKRYTSEK